MKAIYFDMDETLYRLRDVQDWIARLEAEDIAPYYEGKPCGDMKELNIILEDFINFDITIGVITWTAMHGSKEYNKRVRNVKKQWIMENLPCVSEFHCVKYGTPKHRVANIKDSILVDDNADVRKAWKNGSTIDATNYEEVVETLKKMLREIIKNNIM